LAVLVLVRTVADRQEIAAVSSEAAGCGICIGMTLTQARALRSDVRHADHDPAGDRKALEALGRWMVRFTPIVSIADPSEPGEPTVAGAPRPCRPRTTKAPVLLKPGHGLFLDVTGCQRLFHGLENLVRQVMGALQRLGINADVAVAPTPGAAWALAGTDKSGRIITDPSLLPEALAPLPPAALRIEPQTDAMLHHLGLTTVGQLLAIPRELLPARFGDHLLLRIDQALGRAAELFVPLAHVSPISARMDFDGVIDSLETIWLALKKLLEQVVEELLGRGSAAREMKLELFRPQAPVVCRTIRLSQPSRSMVNLFNLLRCGLEDNPGQNEKERREQGGSFSPSSRVLGEGFGGLIGIRLSVPVFEPLTQEQILLLEQEEHEQQVELGRLIERLRIRLGERAVVRAQLVECHLPERAWRVGEGSSEGSGFRVQSSGRRILNPEPGTLHPLFRPLHLLPQPVEVGVIVSPCDAREGRPVSLTRGRRLHRIVHAVGPERIAGLWWEGHDKTRDYFDVQDQVGRRFWIFRVLQTGSWYLHGFFA
jgi:protein ImuB